jgi:hypothetical protein
MAQAAFKIEWDAHEYEHKERGRDWFWAVGIITLSIAVASIIFGNIIFAILIILSAFSLSIFINRPPEVIHASIDQRGVTRGNTLYTYGSLDSFWIDTEHPQRKIIIRSKKILMPLIIVPLGDDIDIDRLENTLSKYLSVEYMRLPLVEYLLEYLGF